MARWIAFDQETTSLLRSNLARGTRIDTLRRGPVDFALARPGAVVAVLPAMGSPDLGIAIFRRARHAVAPQPAIERRTAVADKPAATKRQAAAQPAGKAAATRAGGFLGLSDEAVFEEEVIQEKKGWWRKLWDD
jgi:hypothetical protein